MQEIVPFDFQGNAVRVVRGEDGEPWFHANDVCSVLGFTNPRKAIADHVDADDVTKRDTIDALSRTQQVNYINESGVYALIFGSTKPEAKAFKRWVTHEVLPAIRKSGRYALFSEASIQEAIEVNARLAGLLDSCLSLYSLLGLSGEKRMMAVRKHMLEQYGVNLDEAMPGLAEKPSRLLSWGRFSEKTHKKFMRCCRNLACKFWKTTNGYLSIPIGCFFGLPGVIRKSIAFSTILFKTAPPGSID